MRVILLLLFYTLKQHMCKCHYLAASRQRNILVFKTSFMEGEGGGCFSFSFPVYNLHYHTAELRGFPFSGEHDGWVGNNQHPGWLRDRGWEHYSRQGQRQHCGQQPGHLLGRAAGILGKEGELEGWTFVMTSISETIDEEPSLRLKEGTTY